MKRLFLISLFFIGVSGWSAQSLDTARLFDWFYPSEPAYQSLAEAARAVGRQGWVVSLMQKGEPIPQASARELALDLRFDPKTDPETKDKLRKLFAPESAAIRTAGNGTEGEEISKLEKHFTELNDRMDQLEKTVKKNNYNKQAFPSTGVSFRAAGVNSGGAGMLTGTNDGHVAGGITLNFDGQGDAGGFNFKISETIDHGNSIVPLSSVYQHGSFGSGNPNFSMGYKDATVSVDLGGGHSLKRSALVLGAPSIPGAPNSFVIDMEAGNRPAYAVPELKLGLPFDTWWLPGIIFVNKQGTAPYWPFSTVDFFYGPGAAFLEPYNTSHKRYWGADFELDTGNLWGLVDHNLVYGALAGASNDKDGLRSFGLADSPTGNMGWAFGTDTLLPWGGELFMEYGRSNSYSTDTTYSFNTLAKQAEVEGYPTGKTLTGFERRGEDQGFVAAYTHPIGVLTIGLEYSHIGPLFQPEMGAVSGLMLTGINSDPLVSPYSAGIITPWYNAPTPAGHMENGKVVIDKTSDVAWGTDPTGAAGLMNNSDKVVLQSQFSYSWVSLGVFSGTSSQIEPSGPWVKSKPGFEAGSNGVISAAGGNFLLWNRFGGSYWLPPFPLTAAPAKANADGSPNASYFQWAFNRPADGTAIDSKGVGQPVHWNALAQFAYQKVEYYVLFSEKGVGDPHIDGFSQKYINYVAGTLKLDFQSLLGSLTPFEFQIFGLSSDVAPQAGTPGFGSVGETGSPNQPYFSEIYTSVFGRYGVTPIFTLVGIAGHEEWRSNHSYFPIFTSLNLYGLGFDVDMNKLLTGLGIFSRSRILYFEDYNIGQRQFSVWETSLGTSLDF